MKPNMRKNDTNGSFSRRQLHYSPNLLNAISNAIENNKVVDIEYDSREKGISNRLAEPMAMVYKNGKRHLVGWCRLRDDWRSFRLDRINTFKVMNEAFSARENFDISQFEGDDEYESNEYEEYEEEDYNH